MIRIVCHEADAEMAANVGGPVQQSYKTFEFDLPQLESWLLGVYATYKSRQVIGVEVLPVEEKHDTSNDL